MKVLTFNTNKSTGGAAKACIRLHQGLLNAGIDADLLMLDKPDHETIRGHSYYEYYQQQHKKNKQETPLYKRIVESLQYKAGIGAEAEFNKKRQFENKLEEQKPKHSEVFTFSSSLYQLQEHPLYATADIVHLHWVANHFLDYKKFFLNNSKPVVWTLHDMNPFTGGCHYSEGCEGYTFDCEGCPQLQATDDPDYAKLELSNKLKGLSREQNITIVSPSLWLLNLSKKSSAFKRFSHVNIPNGIDINLFRPREKLYSRKILGIPLDKPVILFVAHDIANKRKGFNYLERAFELLDLEGKVTLCAVGGKKGALSEKKGLVELGSISDEQLMSFAYSAADVFVIPSVEDNLPNTVLESLLCGTPVIGFPTGGILDMINDGSNGYLCKDVSVKALVEKLTFFLKYPEVLNRGSIRADAVDKYDIRIQTERYITLYKELLEEKKP